MNLYSIAGIINSGNWQIVPFRVSFKNTGYIKSISATGIQPELHKPINNHNFIAIKKSVAINYMVFRNAIALDNSETLFGKSDY